MSPKSMKSPGIIKFNCEKISLLSTNYCQKNEPISQDRPRMEVSAEINLIDNGFISTLSITELFQNKVTEEIGITNELSFTISGLFSCEEGATVESIKEVAKGYSLAILWPYAREYSSEILRRTGFNYPLLPIVNPQALTETMMKNNDLKIIDKISQKVQYSE